MANLQQEIIDKINKSKIINYNRTIKVPKQRPIKFRANQTHFDPKREIIINLDFIGEEDLKNETFQNLRIQKLNHQTMKFEFTSYQGRIIFEKAWYNEIKGHLSVFSARKVIVFGLTDDNQSLSIL